MNILLSLNKTQIDIKAGLNYSEFSALEIKNRANLNIEEIINLKGCLDD
jgi:hypothetical protein